MKIVGAIGTINVEKILEEAKSSSCSLQILDAKFVVGIKHIEIAYERTQRSFANGTNNCKSFEMEFLRYVSCERQIKNAIKKVGAKPVGEYAFVFFDKVGCDPEDFVKNLGLKIDCSVLMPSIEKLKQYVSDKELEIIDKSFYWDLLYEKITLLDIIK